MQSLPLSDALLDERLRLIVASFHRLTAKALLESVPLDIAGLRRAIWNAPRAIMAHGTEADPIFFYGNADLFIQPVFASEARQSSFLISNELLDCHVATLLAMTI